MRSTFIDLAQLLTIDRSPPARPRSVVHLLPSLGWGGAERMTCMVHRLAESHGWSSRIDAPGLPELVRGIAEETGRAPDSSPDSLRDWALAARTRIRTERPAIVHAHLPYPDRIATSVLASGGRAMVATFQLLPKPGDLWSPDELLRVRSDRVLAVLSRTSRRARFVAVSEADRRTLARLVPIRRVTHVRNAPPFSQPAATGASRLAWRPDTVHLVSLGRLHAQKGFDRMLEALATPEARALPWQWIIAGDGPEREALLKRIARLGLQDRVTLAGPQPAAEMYAAADLVLSPSRWEGMPLVPMEAIEAGVAVAGSFIEPHRELLGDTPALMLPNDEARWSAWLTALIASAERRSSLRAAQRARWSTDPRGAMWDGYAVVYRMLDASGAP